jgi:hypothetical protein
MLACCVFRASEFTIKVDAARQLDGPQICRAELFFVLQNQTSRHVGMPRCFALRKVHSG